MEKNSEYAFLSSGEKVHLIVAVSLGLKILGKTPAVSK
jgi:hypothetical protein